MSIETFLGLLQFSDGLFPVGSYAHSFGLESYTAAGTIRDASGVQSFLLSYLQGSVAPTDAVAALMASQAARCGLPEAMERCLTIDRSLDAMKPASETPRRQPANGKAGSAHRNHFGRALSLARIDWPVFFRRWKTNETPGHHAMAFGAVGGVLRMARA